MFEGITAALRVLRPRGLTETSRLATQTRQLAEALRDDTRELHRTLKGLRDQQTEQRDAQTHAGGAIEKLTRRFDAFDARQREDSAGLHQELRELRHEVSSLRIRNAQLFAIARRDIETEGQEADLERVLADPGIEAHVQCAVARAELKLHPFPHAVVDDLLPQPLYDALVAAIPPPELFDDKLVNKQQLNVPLSVAPWHARRVWRFVARTAGPAFIMPAVIQKFEGPIRDWLQASFPAAPAELLADVPMTCSDGRIMRRRPGYHIAPHRDPKWGFITCLLYLARPGDDERWGTHLFSVDGETEARGAAPHWIDPERCRLFDTVAFRPNRVLIFLNSVGAHGADIAPDAPASLERYAYQFRVGPTSDAIPALLQTLHPERRAYWEGKVAGY